MKPKLLGESLSGKERMTETGHMFPAGRSFLVNRTDEHVNDVSFHIDHAHQTYKGSTSYEALSFRILSLHVRWRAAHDVRISLMAQRKCASASTTS
jgi:hypothetical protein